jgi:hypothetical protein
VLIEAFNAHGITQDVFVEELKKLSGDSGVFGNIPDELSASVEGKWVSDLSTARDPLMGLYDEDEDEDENEDNAEPDLPAGRAGKKELTNTRDSGILSTVADGGARSGNFGHGGRPGQVGGSSAGGGGGRSGKLSSKDRAKYQRRIVGKKTSTGTELKGFSEHAYQRLAERRISVHRIEQIIGKKPTPSKTHSERDVYEDNGARIVLDRNTGEIVTIMWANK